MPLMYETPNYIKNQKSNNHPHQISNHVFIPKVQTDRPNNCQLLRDQKAGSPIQQNRENQPHSLNTKHLMQKNSHIKDVQNGNHRVKMIYIDVHQ